MKSYQQNNNLKKTINLNQNSHFVYEIRYQFTYEPLKSSIFKCSDFSLTDYHIFIWIVEEENAPQFLCLFLWVWLIRWISVKLGMRWTSVMNYLLFAITFLLDLIIYILIFCVPHSWRYLICLLFVCLIIFFRFFYVAQSSRTIVTLYRFFCC